jgi:dihydrodipicolinate synthase/N-acetylneuraminate lyase
LLPAIQELRAGPQPALNKALLVRRAILDRADVRLPLMPIDDSRTEAAAEVLKRYVKLA